MKYSLYIATKDLKEEFRTRQMLNSMIVFSLLVIVIFSVSFGDMLSSREEVSRLAPGVLWIAFIFSGSIGLSRSFIAETENGCLEALKLSPVSRSSIYTGKMLANVTLMLLVEVIMLPVFTVLFNYPLEGILVLGLVLFLGTFGFIAVGTLISAITVNTRTREILLPILLLPFVLPVLIPAVLATGTILSGGTLIDVAEELRLLVVYDVVFFLIAQLVFEYVLED